MSVLTKFISGILLLSSSWSFAAEMRITVAGNFFNPLRMLAAQFESQTGDTALLSVVPTGKLHVQINNGAPFEIFLAADQKSPAALQIIHLICLSGGYLMPDFSVIWLSLKLAVIVTLPLMALATSLAWWLAQTDSKLKPIFSSLCTLPMVLPPTVLGFYLLLLLGPNSPVAQFSSFIGLLLIYCNNYQCKGKQSLNSQSKSRQSANNQTHRRLVI